MQNRSDKPLFVRILAGVMACIFVFGFCTILYERLKYGPPCEQVSESRVDCFNNWHDEEVTK